MRHIFVSDLDNTLIFSYRHKSEDDICIEYVDSKPQSFCTRKTIAGLTHFCAENLFVPLTTRSLHQYLRIKWPTSCIPEFAMTTNGSILLVKGEIDASWQIQSKNFVLPWKRELFAIEAELNKRHLGLKARMVDDMYLYLPCQNEQQAACIQREWMIRTALQTHHVGRKLYFFPPQINKGTAIDRLRERFPGETVICAGDSIIDVEMLIKADIAIVPNSILLKGKSVPDICINDGSCRFPDFVIQKVLYSANKKEKAAL